jgi:hypothetical protein
MLRMQEMTFPGFKFQKFSPRPLIHTWYIGHTRGHCYPPLIYYLTERSVFKKCPPPTGKSLKKALFKLNIGKSHAEDLISGGNICYRKML